MYFCFQKGDVGAISELFPFTKFFENAPQVSFVSFLIQFRFGYLVLKYPWYNFIRSYCSLSDFIVFSFDRTLGMVDNAYFYFSIIDTFHEIAICSSEHQCKIKYFVSFVFYAM